VKLRCCFPLLCLALGGCTFFSSTLALRIRLPDPPSHWRQAFAAWSWELSFPSPGGGTVTRILPAEQGSALILVPKMRNLPICAGPLLPSGMRLPAAGGVYPLDAAENTGVLELSWRGGFLAELLLKLIGGGVDVAGMNSRRLAEEIWRRSAGDPWRLDMCGLAEALAEALATGGFSVYDIRLLPALDVIVSPGTGQWFLESPFSSPRTSDAAGKLLLPELGVGRHTLFALSGEIWYLLWVNEQAGVLMVPGGS
jgi:hypothetical protein